MMTPSRTVIILAISAVMLSVAPARATIRQLGNVSGNSAVSSVAVWVYFVDKSAAPAGTSTAPHTLARRLAAGFKPEDAAERPVSRHYIERVERLGGTLRSCFKWGNAASFDVPAGSLTAISKLPFVKELTLIGTLRRPGGTRNAMLGKKTSSGSGTYGESFDQLQLLGVPRTHEYLARRFSAAPPGTGVRIAFFDSGFRLRHRSFRYLVEHGSVAGTYDFVDRDTVVEDPDSVVNDYSHPYYRNDEHGSLVLSLVAAYDPPYYCGAAWGAQFLLARTEDTYTHENGTSREVHAEEDNWAAAVVWAESLGVDIISSSVAYRSSFEDSVIIERNDGSRDTIVSYSRSDLDGKTTIVSRAAAGAAARGVLIVNSIGNAGNEGDTSLDAPSDVDGVIAVGMTTLDGRLDSQSSKGPSADGRLKPDVVAPGSGVMMPDIYKYNSPDTYTSDAGSSYAAPLVAGVCALIRQSHPSYDAAGVREALYRFCRLPAGRGVPDNRYGRGIPDALSSCMQHGEVILTATDTGSKPLTDAIVENDAGDTIGRFDATGMLLLHEVSGALRIRRGADIRTLRIDSTPGNKTLFPCSLTIRVRDENRHVVPVATLNGRIGSAETTLHTDSLGNVTIVSFFQPLLQFVAFREGYVPSDTFTVTLTDEPQEHTITIIASNATGVAIFPTVIRRWRGDVLRIRCRAPLSSAIPPNLQAEIRSINGHLIWGVNRQILPPCATIEWNCRSSAGDAVAPGTYFVQLAFDGKKQRKKILVVP